MLLEAGVELPPSQKGNRGRAELVRLAREAFAGKPMPKPPAPPSVHGGIAAILRGALLLDRSRGRTRRGGGGRYLSRPSW